MREFISGIIIFLMFGCAMPTTSVRSIDERPSIAIEGASPGADLYVDGLNMGKASFYNGAPKTLKIESGTHQLSVVENGSVVYEQTIFLDSEIKTITLQ